MKRCFSSWRVRNAKVVHGQPENRGTCAFANDATLGHEQ